MKIYGFLGTPRLVGYMNRKDFIDKVQELTHCGINFIHERTCETRNEKEVKLAKNKPLTVIDMTEKLIDDENEKAEAEYNRR